MAGEIAVALIGGIVVGVNGLLKAEILKGTKTDLTEDVKKKVSEEGIYHITSKANAEKIMQSLFLAPTVGNNGDNGNHFLRSRDTGEYADYVYMFAGKPTLSKLISNLGNREGDGTIYAIKHTPDQFEINNYEQRLEDDALLYEGVLDLTNSHPEMVRMKIEKRKINRDFNGLSTRNS